MGDRLYEYKRYSNPIQCTGERMKFAYDYSEEDGGTEGAYEEEEFNDIENGEISEELACPFCPEDFDVLGLCCHIDADHRMEVKAGICPLCAMKALESSRSVNNAAVQKRVTGETITTPRTIESASSAEASLSGKSSNDNSLVRIQPSFSQQMEKMRGQGVNF